MGRRRSGRRGGDSGTREAIATAAARQFGELGFDRTSLRSIAAEAGVDPALVSYFFGSKQKLFVQTVELPFPPETEIPRVFGGDREHVGERLAGFIVGLLEDPDKRQRVVGIARAAASEPEAARIFRERLTRDVLTRIVETLDVDDAPLRASLVASQLVGLVMARHVVAVEPLASLPGDELAVAIAPNLQRYIAEPLDRPEGVS